ncbi:MAG: hypothetical protein HFE64_06285 [Lachnospiraceae bacterium]|jgi:hypothetical protein|nr:hypothetical protein [Lachnospiraceae bacterium]
MAGLFRKSTLRFIQGWWGKEDESQDVNFHDVEDFFVRMMKKEDWILDDLTWNDLDMNRSYMKMNRTLSMPGQQCLYNMLRILRFDEDELKRRGRMIDFFQHNKDKREAIQCLLYYMGKEEYDGAASVLFKGTPPLPPSRGWVIPSTLGMIASIISLPFLWTRAVVLIVIFFIMNMIIHHSINKYTEASMPGIRYIARMLVAAKEIEKLQYPELDNGYNEFFKKAVDKCQIILKKNKVLKSGAADPLGLSEYIKIAFLTEARAYIRTSMYIEQYAPVLRTLYRRLGELDAFQSMASVRRGMRQSCKPKFVEDKDYFSAVAMGHPLLKGAVCNDITIDHKNVVLTGSNMSGKSTFLRTIGLNLILAQTFYMVMAKEYKASFFNILSSISPSDDMMEGRSYYMAEAEALLRMIHVVDEERCSLLLIDEIFRGTNPTERVAAASSLLTYLSEHHCMVVVATHDIEITENVKEQYDSYHFEENVTKEALEFDYLLKPGVLKKPNGIRILEYIGYPEEITQRALASIHYEGEDKNEDI